MQRPVQICFIALALSACGDDGGGTGTDGSGSTTAGSSTGGSSDSASMSGTAGSTGSPATSSTSGSSTGSASDDSSTSGDTATSAVDSSGADTSSSGGGVFTVTSPDFVEGELFPFNMHICEGNTHPQLDWENAPAGTMSFGVYFHDVSISFEHSAIWDIPADASGLPSGVEAVAMPPSVPGALQCSHWNGGVGYGGPGSCSNIYQFTVYALDVAELQEVTVASDRFAVRAALDEHAIETATLSGQTRGATCIPGCVPNEA